MKTFTIQYKREAVLDAAYLLRHEPQAFKKLKKLEQELAIHPRTGTGKTRTSFC